MIAALLAQIGPWLAGLAGLLGIGAAVYAKGRSDKAAAQKAAQDRATIETRTRIDEAVTHAPDDAVAARAALAKRVPDAERTRK